MDQALYLKELKILFINPSTQVIIMYAEESFIQEVMDRTFDGYLTRSDAEFMITEHGHSIKEFEQELGDSILDAAVLLEFLGY